MRQVLQNAKCYSSSGPPLSTSNSDTVPGTAHQIRNHQENVRYRYTAREGGIASSGSSEQRIACGRMRFAIHAIKLSPVATFCSTSIRDAASTIHIIVCIIREMCIYSTKILYCTSLNGTLVWRAQIPISLPRTHDTGEGAEMNVSCGQRRSTL